MSVSGEQEFSVEIAASQQRCFATIIDFERYPEWFSSIQEAVVLSRYEDGLGREVEFRINMTLKTIRYVLEYSYEKPSRLWWRSIDGDVDSIEGNYVLQKIDAKRTQVTCRQAVAVGFWVPGPIRKLLEQTALRQSVLDFKAAAEAAQATAATTRGGKKSKG
ncbi:MAG: SRPBCC family protein [Deltaproteobacteria bacterium]|nr:SRPBCC family protein [Deltaproteobacteria bacterium]